MRTNFPRALSLAVLLISSSAGAQSRPTGNWTGTYTFSVQLSACQNKTFTSSGNVAVTLLQTGTSLSGRIDLTNLLLFNGNCNPAAGELTNVVVGTISGSSIAWSLPNDSNMTQFSGSIDGDNVTAQISDVAGGSGSLTMARASADPPAVDLTGTWSGDYNFTDRCPNGGTQSYTGAFTFGLTQSGANAGGVVTIQNVPLYDQNCRKITSLNMSLAAAGTVSGSTFTGVVFDPSGSFEFPINATIANAAMSGTVAGASATATTGTFAITRGSTAAPGSEFSGTWQGSYSEVDDERAFCLNIRSLAFDGPASLSIVQAGNAVSGWLIFQGALDVRSDGFGNCVVVEIGDQVLPLYGTLSGNALTLLQPLGGGVQVLYMVTFNGDTVNGTITDSFGDFASFTATKSASAAPPVISNFGATPSAIFIGQSSTLSWSASNATAVSIDNGIGSKPVSGSMNVSPAQTTIYTLTATGPAGSVSAQTTIAVFPPGPKRRAVRP
jgi:hypothetical protein